MFFGFVYPTQQRFRHAGRLFIRSLIFLFACLTICETKLHEVRKNIRKM